MRRWGVVLVAILAVASLMIRWGTPQPLTSGEQHLIRATNRFALDQIRALPPDDNQLVSPTSLAAVWAMLYAGSQGPAHERIAQTLHFSGPPLEVLGSSRALLARLRSAEVRLVSRLFATPGFLKPPYVRSVGAECDELPQTPEAASARVNSWAARETSGRIDRLLSPSDVPAYQAAAMLVSALYFKCRWKHEFNVAATQDAPFYLASGGPVTASMMLSHEAEFEYLSLPDLEVVSLPYRTSPPRSLLLLLPARKDGLADLQAGLTVEGLERWQRLLHPERLFIQLPHIKFQRSYRAEDLGLDSLLKGADLSPMTDQPVDRLSHKHATWIEVNEVGTEAVAVTVASEYVTGGGSSARMVRADHPFLFLIRDDETGCILFIGRLMDPTR